MASPKNRVSKRRKRERVASLEKPIIAAVGACPACGAAVRLPEVRHLPRPQGRRGEGVKPFPIQGHDADSA